MADKTIVVVGRGIAGLAAAWELAKAGFTVQVIGPRREDEPRGVGSRAATGISSLKGAVLPRKDLFAAKAEGHELLPAWLSALEAESGVPIPRRFCGMSELFFDLTGYEGIRSRVFHRKFTGCYRAEVLAIKELSEGGGDLSPFGLKPLGGFFYPRDGWYEAEAALDALEEALRRRRVRLVDDSVQSIAEHAVTGLEICGKNGTIRCDEAVLATGVWTDQILAASGFSTWPQQAVFAGETLRGEGDGEVITSFAKTSLVAFGGRVQYGSTCYASALFAGPDPARVEDLRAKFRSVAPLPALSEVLFGLRARAPDRLPTLGPLFFPSGARRLWLMTGLYKNGLQLAPLFARNLCRFFASSTASGPFLPTRF